jgi:hypothetical protein
MSLLERYGEEQEASRASYVLFTFSSLAQMAKTMTFVLCYLPFLTNLGDPKALSIFVLDPLDALQLRVHHEWPALTVDENGSILHRHAICGEALILPGGHVGIICQHP